MMIRDIRTIWTFAESVGGCCGCAARGAVLKITMRGTTIRLCEECWRFLKADAERASTSHNVALR